MDAEIVSEEVAGETDLSIVIFAYDEEENVGAILTELLVWLRSHEPTAEVIFVDDGSKDQTAGAAAAALRGHPHRVVRHSKNRGIGAALKTGVRCAHGAWVTFLPADGQIEPAAIGTLRDAQRRSDVNLVLSVYRRRDDGLDRKVFSLGIRSLIFAIHGVWLRSDGPYLFRRDRFDPERLPPDSFFLNFEFPIRSLAAKETYKVVTIECRQRRAGFSKSTQWNRIVGVGKDLIDLRRRRFVESVSSRFSRSFGA